MAIYVYLIFKKLLKFEDDSLNLEKQGIDLDELDEISYKNSKMFIFYTLRKQKGAMEQNFMDPELQRYIHVNFMQRRDNWFKKVGEGRFEKTEIPARMCTKEDFIKVYNDKKIGELKFKEWNGFYLICPDLDEDQDLYIKGQKSSFLSSIAMM